MSARKEVGALTLRRNWKAGTTNAVRFCAGAAARRRTSWSCSSGEGRKSVSKTNTRSVAAACSATLRSRLMGYACCLLPPCTTEMVQPRQAYELKNATSCASYAYSATDTGPPQVRRPHSR